MPASCPSMQTPPRQVVQQIFGQHCWPVGHGEPPAPQLPVAHKPFVQAEEPWHWLPQKPQLFLSVFLSTHAFVQQICVPVHVAPPQEQLPLVHVWLPVHFLPHWPQLAASVSRFLQPLLQQESPAAHAWPLFPEHPQRPITQSGDGPGRQALPHCPQLLVSVLVSVQTLLQHAWAPQCAQRLLLSACLPPSVYGTLLLPPQLNVRKEMTIDAANKPSSPPSRSRITSPPE